MHVMLDLETWSTEPDAAIISIGACVFDPLGAGAPQRFYCAIEPETCIPMKRHIDPNTVIWWMQPQRAAPRDAWLSENKVDLMTALYGLSDWMQAQRGETEFNDVHVWGNGAPFDNVILRSSYKACGLETPWPHWNDRCYRTLKAQAPEIKLVRSGTYHNAVDDAVSQAQHMQAICHAKGLKV